MRPLLTALIFFGATMGALDVAAIAAADRHQAPWLAGALPATFAAAGLVGGALYVRWQPASAPTARHLTTVGALFAASWLPLLVPASPAVMLLLIALLGAMFVPLLTVASLMVTALAPPGTSTEAVGWVVSAARMGLAMGTALAGPLGGHFTVPLLAAAVCALLLAACTAPAPAARSTL
jgi:predicted MFS family arabinose efflux permease